MKLFIQADALENGSQKMTKSENVSQKITKSGP